MHDVLQDFAAGRPSHPTFEEGLEVQKVLDAVDRSSKTRTWQKV
jgi:predicted dehydrogenase